MLKIHYKYENRAKNFHNIALLLFFYWRLFLLVVQRNGEYKRSCYQDQFIASRHKWKTFIDALFTFLELETQEQNQTRQGQNQFNLPDDYVR